MTSTLTIILYVLIGIFFLFGAGLAFMLRKDSNARQQIEKTKQEENKDAESVADKLKTQYTEEVKETRVIHSKDSIFHTEVKATRRILDDVPLPDLNFNKKPKKGEQVEPNVLDLSKIEDDREGNTFTGDFFSENKNENDESANVRME